MTVSLIGGLMLRREPVRDSKFARQMLRSSTPVVLARKHELSPHFTSFLLLLPRVFRLLHFVITVIAYLVTTTVSSHYNRGNHCLAKAHKIAEAI
jgi:hypothetical protein